MIVVETGQGLPDANSYASVVEADAYFAARMNQEWAALSLEEKEAALIKATDFLDTVYGQNFVGTTKSAEQSLAWPREGAYLNQRLLSSSLVPGGVLRATYEAAVRSISGPLLKDLGQRVTREKVDVLEVEYAEFADPQTRFPAVAAALTGLLRGFSSGTLSIVRLERV